MPEMNLTSIIQNKYNMDCTLICKNNNNNNNYDNLLPAVNK